MSQIQSLNNPIGKPWQIKFVFNLLVNSGNNENLLILKKFCFDESLEFSRTFNGIIELLEYLGYIEKREKNLIQLIKFPEFDVSKLEILSEIISKKLINKLIDDNCLNEYIDLDSFDYDADNSHIIILNSSIPLKSSNLKQFLIDTNVFLHIKNDVFRYRINDQFSNYFENSVIPWLKTKSALYYSSGLTFEEFKKNQALKEIYGEEAELFVEKFERKRLTKHINNNLIKKISHLKVDAGYDVISFDSISSKEFDRFIEVKSFSNNPYFYWSKNEMKVAHLFKEKYFLYLVDRNQMDQIDYHPIIIPNPSIEIMKNSLWRKETQSIYFELENNN
jgi:hypothetical protein